MTTTTPTIEHELRFDLVTAATRMSKREAATLVRFLTDAIAETPTHLIDVRIDLRNVVGGAVAQISVNNNTLFGSTAVITDSRIINQERK